MNSKEFGTFLSGIKAIHISDIHIGNSIDSHSTQVLKTISKSKPDIIFLTGDYVKWTKDDKTYKNATNFLAMLEAPLGVYAVMGDSDYSNARSSCIFCHESMSFGRPAFQNVNFLKNTGETITTNNRKVFVFGLDSSKNQIIYEKLHNIIPDNIPTIILSHSSEVYNAIDPQKHVLVLSGDTHGGQILLPNIFWKLLKRKTDPDHMYGFYKEGNKMLYVTSGIGTSDIPIRLGVKPEIVEFSFSE